MNQDSRLEHFPVSFFAIVMGLAGLTLAWEKAQSVFRTDLHINPALMGVTGLVFLLLLLLYLVKMVRHGTAVKAELKNPVKLSFFPTISISLILLSICTLHMLPGVARVLWLTGTLLHLLFTFYVMNVWIHHEHFQIQHINPAWFIPVVGNVLVPIAGVRLGYGEVSWFFFSIGMLFWLVLLSIIFNRILFHNPLPGKLMPTFFILIAPPAVGFIAYIGLTGEIDAFARVLYYSGLFLTFLLLLQTRRFTRLPFFLSWWAYSFPVAAITIATFVMYEKTGLPLFQTLSLAFLALVSLIVAYLVVRTLVAIARRGICQPEG
ncbi:MAG TPA: C4-dicarboxylate ABC transporter [Sedimenticola thiotaurini]|uniref:C4-dicarboxylate ABC transporter n=1 Tax=Sedimenticola thiotaurini TaxID=1543721 RepID=A0A831RMH5_9GAMM|nr:C4-dicarboxylate ABC transporter [Sedimenticola thiotaurini]